MWHQNFSHFFYSVFKILTIFYIKFPPILLSCPSFNCNFAYYIQYLIIASSLWNKVFTSPIFPIKFYKSLYLKNVSIKTCKSYICAHFVLWTCMFIEASLLQRVRFAHFSRCNCYQLLSDVTGMPDISLPSILFCCIIVTILFGVFDFSNV